MAYIMGGEGNDNLVGTAGDDTLEGGAGFDTLTGGSGDDTFVFSGTNRLSEASITDFGDGDRLDLSALNLPFAGETVLPGNAAGYQGLGHIRYRTVNSATHVEIDANGDGISEQTIVLAGWHSLRESAGFPGLLVRAPDVAVAGTEGDDTLIGGDGHDTLTGGAGNDVLLGLGGHDSLDGGAGDDSLVSGAGNDTLIGGAGNDTLVSGEGSTMLTGGPGDDTFRFTSLAGRSSKSITDCGDGDRLDLSALNLPSVVYGSGAAYQGIGHIRYGTGSSFTRVEIDTNGDGWMEWSIELLGQHTLRELVGSPGILVRVPDLAVAGTGGNDTLVGGEGHDTLTGGAGNDVLLGLGGHDSLDGGDGDDSLVGGAGNDMLIGGAGNDTLIGGAGNDTLIGGAGDDTFRFVLEQPHLISTITDFSAGDRIDLSSLGLPFIGHTGVGGLPSGYYGKGYIGYRPILGSTLVEIDWNGDGMMEGTLILHGQHALEEAVGTPGVLVLRGSQPAPGTSPNSGVGAGLPNQNNLPAQTAHQLIFGESKDDTLRGGIGNDTMLGGVGNDLLAGGDGADLISGDEGNDTLLGEEGSDTVIGGLGDDVIFGMEGDDLLTGDEGADTIVAGDGNDSILGGVGNDLLGGGAGDDLIDGGAGNDTLLGDAGNDTLFGGDGNDLLRGFAGNDWLIGGAGRDVCSFGFGDGHDLVFDFNPEEDTLSFVGVTVGQLIAGARVSGGNTVFSLSDGSTLTVLGRTGITDAWFT